MLKSDFNKNVLTLLTGTTVAQALPIAISPILTRVYSPEDFGVLALFIAITTIFGSIANARYELAIVLPEKEEESINLVALSILIASFFSALLMFIVTIFHDNILNLIGNETISFWLYFIPPVVFLIGLFNALNYLNTRRKLFKNIAIVNMYKSLILTIFQLGLGIIKSGAMGLITGQILSHLIANGKLASTLMKDKILLSKISINEIKRLAKKYSNFPKFSMWAILANNLSQHLTSLFISSTYSITSLGFYSLVQRILGMPISVIGNSFGQVFFQKAAEEKNETGIAIITFKATLIKLIIISIPLFLVLYLCIEEIVAFVFGEEWRIAGIYAKFSMPLFFIRFISNPLSTVTSIFDKQKVALIWQFTLLVLTLSIFMLSIILSLDILSFLTIFSSVIFFHYIILLFISYKICKGGTF